MKTTNDFITTTKRLGVVASNDAGFKTTELSEWRCFLFGGNNGMIWRPEKGHVPNRFWRWMQYICFGNKWKKDNAK